MANINSVFEVKKTGDQSVVVRFPKGFKVGESIGANSLVKVMLELALCDEHDVDGQALLCCGDGPGTCCMKKDKP